LHDGRRSFPAALECLDRVRQAGLAVILVSNSPRPHDATEAQLHGLGIQRNRHFDAVLTAGDLARDAAIAEGGRACYHLGPDRDHAALEGLRGPVVDRLEEAGYILCTGFVEDERETVADYRDLLRRARDLELPMICANPDLIVHRGDDEVPCAGLLAEAYEKLGGVVHYFGKPYGDIYRRALAWIGSHRGHRPPPEKVLGLGDGLETDIRGAHEAGLTSLFITSGIHRTAFDTEEREDDAALQALFEERGQWPDWVMDRLQW
jgi:HAD superfamily hydrolase (TIGR01459 family)